MKNNIKYLGRGKFDPPTTSKEHFLLGLLDKPISRRELSQRTGIPYSTLFYYLREMMKNDPRIKKFSAQTRRRGRAVQLYQRV